MEAKAMTIVNVPILNLKREAEFRDIFAETYLNSRITFEGFAVKIFPEDFDHICFEYAEDGKYKKKFSRRRARRLLFIREICAGKLPYILIHQIARDNKSVCVLCEAIEFAIFLVPKTSKQGNYFRVGTILAYGQRVESRIEKQKKKGVLIKKAEEAF